MISTAILSALHSAALYYRERTRSTGRRDPSADGTNVFVYLSMLPLAQTHTRSAVQPSDDILCRRGALRLRNVRDAMITQSDGSPRALWAGPRTRCQGLARERGQGSGDGRRWVLAADTRKLTRDDGELGPGVRQPEGHLHLAEHRDGGAEVEASFLLVPDATVQLPEPKVAVGLERAHLQRLG